MDLAELRAPSIALAKGFYESHYLTATDPEGGRAVWIRQTWLKAPGQAAVPTRWLTWFTDGEPTALRYDGISVLDPRGTASGQLAQSSWDLTWFSDSAPVPYLPKPWLYDRPVPRSNGIALVPHARVSGTLDVEGERVELRDWHGMVGHNWGFEHADHWVWLHGATDEAWFDLLLVRVRVGRVLTPWLSAGAVHLEGVTHSVPRTGVRQHGNRFRIGGFTVVVTAAPQRTVHWDYASPHGQSREVTNCSVADASLAYQGKSVEFRRSVAIERGAPAR